MIIEQKKQYLIRTVIITGELLLLTTLLLLIRPLPVPDLEVDDTIFRRTSILFILSFALSSIISGQVLQHHFIRGDEILWRSLKANIIFFCLSILILAMLKSPLLHWQFLLPLFSTQILFNFLFRTLMRWIVKRFRSRNSERKGALLVGNPNGMKAIVYAMDKDPSTGYTMLGYFAEEPDNCKEFAHLYKGTLDELDAYLEKHHEDVNELFCTLPSAETERIKRIIHFCENNVIRFIGIPTTYDFIRHRATTLSIDGSPAIILREAPLESIDNRFIKRTFDIAFSLIFLFTAFPLILLVFIPWIKLSSPGPVFFKQKRSGLNGKEFMCYKFRSMRVNAQADKLQATENDPRKTTVGNFMRKTNIDELPQFINVLRGDMSIVGPRPHMLVHTEQYRQLIDKYMVRHFVRPGITGWAQVTGFRGETKELWQMEGRVEKDIWYIEHWSFTLDLWIIIKTIFKTGEKNAY